MTNRPIASLTPTLLARKGAARPAMRPQLQPLRAFQDNTARQLDDLGWNDMGNDVSAATAQPVPQTPVEIDEEPQSAAVIALSPAAEPVPTPVPAVVRQQEAIAERIVQAPAQDSTKARRSALSDGRRAAFTLRLDSERHLKLRLACVTSNRSAQQLLIEALDRLIADLPDVADLAARVRKSR